MLDHTLLCSLRMRGRHTLACLLLLLGLAACGNSGDDDTGDGADSGSGRDASTTKLSAEIGTPDPSGNLDFVPLDDGGDIELGTFGQGGTHAILAVRCVGFGNKAFVVVTLENLTSGAMVSTLPSSRPQLLICRDTPKGACDMLPINVMTGGLAAPEEKDGLRIRVTAKVRGEKSGEATATSEGVLRKSF
jgi:hypothetical protein